VTVTSLVLLITAFGTAGVTIARAGFDTVASSVGNDAAVPVLKVSVTVNGALPIGVRGIRTLKNETTIVVLFLTSDGIVSPACTLIVTVVVAKLASYVVLLFASAPYSNAVFTSTYDLLLGSVPVRTGSASAAINSNPAEPVAVVLVVVAGL
jgi:hypothetical protein